MTTILNFGAMAQAGTKTGATASARTSQSDGDGAQATGQTAGQTNGAGGFAALMARVMTQEPEATTTGQGKLTKLAQGAVDLHSGRSQVDFAGLAQALGVPQVAGANTVLEVSQSHGAALLAWLLPEALKRAEEALPGVTVDF